MVSNRSTRLLAAALFAAAAVSLASPASAQMVMSHTDAATRTPSTLPSRSPQERILLAAGPVAKPVQVSTTAPKADCTKKNCVLMLGYTADSKYKIYDLEGDINDFSYFAPRANRQYTPDELVGRMGWVDEADMKAGTYRCDFVCKNRAGQIVGLSPTKRWMVDGAKKK